MSAPSRNQHNQVSNSVSSNSSVIHDTIYGNTLMDPGFPAFPQWPVSQAWNNMSLPSYNFNLPLQNDYTNNNGFFQNQQNELPDYDGNDDFYDNEMNKPDNSSKTNVPSKYNLSSLASQINVVTPTKPSTEGSKATAVDSSNRAAELRAMLLAKKRPGSATPSARRASRKESDDAKIKTGSSERENKEIDVNSIETRGKNSEAIASSKETAPFQSTDKSSQNPSNAQSLPTHNADIEGLIDEYRAPEADKGSNLPAATANLSESNNENTNGLTNGSHAVAPTLPKSNTTVNLQATLVGSPGSPESGEIHSDQEQATTNDEAKTSLEKVNNGPHKTIERKSALGSPDQRQSLKTPQVRLDTPKQSTVPPKPRQGSQVQDIDRRKSANTNAEPRNIPLAQRIAHVRKEEIQSPSLQDTRSGNNGTDKVDNRNHQQPAPTSSVAAQPRPRLPSRTATGPRPDRHEHERKQNEELAALYKRQLAGQNTPSPRSKAPPEENGKSRINEPQANSALANGIAKKPAEQPAPNDLTSGTLRYDQGNHSLTLLQYEQIQRLGIDLSPKGLNDLYEFLEYHRFYVEEYREGFFARQTRIKALEAEKIALERESLLQFDHFNSMRSQSLAAREHTEPPTPVPVQRIISGQKPSTKPMPPPLNLPKRTSNVGVGDIPDSAISSKSATQPNGNVTPRNIPLSSPSSLKRHRPEDDIDLDQSKKVARVDTEVRSNGKGQEISPRTTSNDQGTHDRRYSSDYKSSGYEFRGRSRSPNERRSLSGQRRASDIGYPSRQNSWAYGREQEYYPSRDHDYRRPSADGLRRDSASTLCRNCDRVGHFTTNCPEERRDSRPQYTPSRPVQTNDNDDSNRRKDSTYSSHNYASYSNRGYRGGSRGGRAGYQSNKPRLGFSSYSVGSAPSGWKGSESLDLKAGGQSRSESSGLDLP
ncbi:MAG: hypothetical protein Q9213_007719 [Squamulea squamosa]